MPDSLDPEIRAAVRSILLDWVAGDPEAIERFLGWIPEQFTGYGTGPGDYYADLDDLRAMLVREHEGMSHPFTLDIPRMTVLAVGPGAAVAEGILEIAIEVEGAPMVEVARFTFAFARDGERWRLAHFHFSVADAMQGHRGTMDNLVTERTRQLEAEVKRRTADLKAAQDQLVQSEKMASLGTLTAGIAHEIKNPLNFVTNFASLSQELLAELADETDPDERAAIVADLQLNVEKIEAHGRRADRIVRSMMDHARSGSGQRQPADLNALVAEYTGHAAHAARVQDPTVSVTPTVDLGADVGTVELVPQEIGRVVVNLVGNAIYAVRKRKGAAGPGYEPSVTVATRRTEGGVEVRVADNGTGIPDALRDRVFEPFFTTKPTGEGTGLGLSLSHDIVTLGHRGSLTVASVEGEGTTFTITLPA